MKAILKLLFLLTSLVAVAQEGEYTYTNFLTKGEIIADKKLKVRDPLLSDQSLASTSPVMTYFTKVSLVYGREDFTDVGTNNEWKLNVKFKIEYSGNLVLANKTLTKGLELEIKGGSVNPVYVANMAMTENYGAVALTVTSVTSTGTVPADIRLELSLSGNRVQNLEVNKAPELFYDAASNKLSWSYLPGADSYELEWAFIDTYDNLGQIQTPFFIKEPVKIITGEPFFYPNLTLPDGKVYFRVRGVGTFKDADNNSLSFTPWSYGNPSQTSVVVTTLPFEKDKLWQYTSSFAEDGKFKKVMNFYDGSMRSRQVSTNLSTDNGTLVAETKYDYEGRPIVQVMPTFISGSNLGYVPSLNNFENTALGKAAYDNPASDALPLSKAKVPLTNHADVNGAASYYSSDNVPETLNRNYLPDAEQYPYSLVEYMPDNTGRLKRQSGIGETFKMKKEDARITKYFYTGTFNAELHRLFGATTLPGNPGPATGNPEYYTKDYVSDPNGQLSVSYKDQAGRVIATGLAGSEPNNLLAIDRDDPDIVVNLMEKNILDKEKGVSKSVSKIMQTLQGGQDFEFDYKLTPVINKVTGDICTACTYELTIRILDPEGVPVTSLSTAFPKSHEIKPGQNETINCAGTANSYTPYTWHFKQKLVPIGEYTIIKEIKLTAGAIDQVRIALEQNPPTESIIGVPEFPDLDALEVKYKQLADAKAPMCDVSCEQMARTALPMETPPREVNDANIKSWINQYCNPKSITDKISDKECSALREEMKQQVSPGGFYNNVAWIAANVWQNASLAWSGNKPANIEDMADPQKFKDVWSEIMVPAHPEYCHYEFCMMERETRTFDKNRSLLQNWGEAGVTSESQLSGYNLFSGDPLLKDFTGISYTWQSQRQSINNTLTNDLPNKQLNYFNEQNGGSGNQVDINKDGVFQMLSLSKFVFASGLYSQEGLTAPQFTNADDNAKTWRLFSNLYLGYKTRRLTELREQKGCPYRRQGRLGQFTQAEIDNAVAQYPLEEGINNIDDLDRIKANVDTWINNKATELCNSETLDDVVTSWIDRLNQQCQLGLNGITPKLTGIQLTDLKAALKRYAVSNCGLHNVNYSMFTEDLLTSPDLISAQSILTNNVTGCNLSFLTTKKPCTTKTLVTYSIHPVATAVVALVNELISATMYLGSGQYNGLIEGNGRDYGFNCGVVSPIFGHIANCGYDLFSLSTYNAYWYLFNSQQYFRFSSPPPADKQYMYSLHYLPNMFMTWTNYYPDNYNVYQSETQTLLIANVQFDKARKILNLRINPVTKRTLIADILFLDNTVQYGVSLRFPIKQGFGDQTIYNVQTNDFQDIVIKNPVEIKVCENDPVIDPCPNIKKLTITNRPTTSKTKRAWRIYNPNSGDIKIDWQTNASVDNNGSLVVKGNSLAYLYTSAESEFVNQSISISVLNKNTKPVTAGQPAVPSLHASAYSTYFPAQIYTQGVWSGDATECLWSFYNPYTFDVDINWTFGTQNGIHRAKARKETYLSTNRETESAATHLLLTSTVPLYNPDLAQETQMRIEGYPTPEIPEDLYNTNCDIDEAIIKQNCLDDLYRQAEEDAWKEYKILLDNYVTHYISQHHNKCFDNPYEEVFTAKYKPGEYHFTLYYYDQAGSLVQTVPPEGVDIQEVNPLTGLVTTIPAHRLKTTYKYNSLGQLVFQHTPDAGDTYFWYNNMGQLRLSQNAKQAQSAKYSVSKYDLQGRVVLTGQLNYLSADPKVPANAKHVLSIIDNPEFPTDMDELSEISVTEYDTPTENAGFRQENLRNRVSAVYQVNEFPYVNAATFYSYDQHGNVKELVQKVNPEPTSANLMISKDIRYKYDLVSGKVNRVDFQKGETDQFSHKYRYDADNRLVSVKTSADGYLWEEDARYFYLKHGPLGRIELGEDKVQGLDHFYTLQGWLKGINIPDARTGTKRIAADPGKDGFTPDAGTYSPNRYIAQDEYALSLGYFSGDYKPVGGAPTPLGYADANSWNGSNLGKNIRSIYQGADPTAKGLYNGNIAYTIQQVHQLAEGVGSVESNTTLAYTYQYDQLNRIRNGYAQERSGNTWSRGAENLNASKFDVMYTYEPNGNILSAKVNGSNGAIMDALVYQYNFADQTIENGVDKRKYLRDNKLYHVKKSLVSNTAESQLKWQGEFDLQESTINTVNNYGYDAIGNLIRDNSEGIASIEWTLGGKVKRVNRTANSTASNLEFLYDAMGNRVLKIKKGPGNSVTPSNTWEYTYYLRDASGNVMQTRSVVNGIATSLENPVYGSSRLGVFKNYSDHNVVITGGYSGPRYKGGNDLTMDDGVSEYTVNNGATLFIPDGQTISGNIILSQGSTLVVEGTLGTASTVTMNGASTIWVSPSGSWNAGNITLKNEVNLKNYGHLNLTGTLNFESPCNFVNYGTLTSAISEREGAIMNRAGVWMVSGAANQSVSMVSLPNGKMEIDYIPVEYSTATTTAFQRFPIKKEYELNDHLGNVMAVVTGRASGVDLGTDGKADYYTANVIDANLYYPFGANLPNRKGGNLVNYRYSFNGQEKTDELGSGHYTAEYWEYDSRIGKRWNLDPVPDESESQYAVNKNNPIQYSDPNGDCPTCYDEDGRLISDVDGEDVANALATDILSAKHSLYNVALSLVYSDTRATFVENEDGNYETGFVKTDLTETEDLVNLGLDLLNVVTLGKGGGPTLGLLAKTPGKAALTNLAKQTVKINGNSKVSPKVQHGYVIKNAKGEIQKYGISGQKLNKNGTSPRANSQLKKHGTGAKAEVVKKNIPGREKALNWEKGKVDAYKKSTNNKSGKKPPVQQRP